MIYVYYLQNDSKLVLIGLAINMIFVGNYKCLFPIDSGNIVFYNSVLLNYSSDF